MWGSFIHFTCPLNDQFVYSNHLKSLKLLIVLNSHKILQASSFIILFLIVSTVNNHQKILASQANIYRSPFCSNLAKIRCIFLVVEWCHHATVCCLFYLTWAGFNWQLLPTFNLLYYLLKNSRLPLTLIWLVNFVCWKCWKQKMKSSSSSSILAASFSW